MPADLYLTAHFNAKRVRLVRSNFLAYRTSSGLSGGCEHPLSYYNFFKLTYSREEDDYSSLVGIKYLPHWGLNSDL